jgi:hypothetical protein
MGESVPRHRRSGFAIFKEHVHDFLQISLQFIKRLALTVRARPAGNVSCEQPGFRIALHHNMEGSHALIILPRGPASILRMHQGFTHSPGLLAEPSRQRLAVPCQTFYTPGPWPPPRHAPRPVVPLTGATTGGGPIPGGGVPAG